jgi:hypothetical protein
MRARLAHPAPAQRAARPGKTVRLRVVIIGGSARNGSRLGGLGQFRGGEGYGMAAVAGADRSARANLPSPYLPRAAETLEFRVASA